jgi:hypothetical protein
MNFQDNRFELREFSATSHLAGQRFLSDIPDDAKNAQMVAPPFAFQRPAVNLTNTQVVTAMSMTRAP